MDISLTLIEAFLTVAGCGSITAAARERHVTQPAMSLYIHKLEEELGQQVFIRRNRGVELTELGSKLLAELDPVYMRFTLSVRDIVARYIPSEQPSLRVGAYHYPDYIAILEALTAIATPTPPPTCEYYDCNALRELLLCGELDLALMPRFELCEDFDFRQLTTPQLSFIVPKQWRVGELSELSERVLLLEPNRSRDTVLAICAAHGISVLSAGRAEPRRLRYVNSLLLLANLIESGEGFTVNGTRLPRTSNVDFLPIESSDATAGFDICAAWRKGSDSEQLALLLEQLGTLDCGAVRFDAARSNSRWYAE